MKTLTIAIRPDGSVEYIDSQASGLAVGRTTKRRASNVLPVGLLQRVAFVALRRLCGECGTVADWTRRWKCQWRVFIIDGPSMGPFDNRSEAIDWEVDWIARNRL